MIRIYRYDPEKNCGAWLPSENIAATLDTLKVKEEMIWIDLECPSEEEETLVFQKFFPIHSLSLEDVTHLKRKPDEPPHFPKVEEFPDYLFVIVNPLAQRLLENLDILSAKNSDVFFEDGSPVTQLTAVLTHTLLVTHHYEAVQGVNELRSYLDRHASTARGPDYLFHRILDETVDEYAPVLDHFSETLEEHEVRIFKKPTPKMLAKLISCKRAIIVLRKTLIHEREILARLCRGEFALIDEREAAYYRNVLDHVIRFHELIEASRESVSDLLQLHLAASSNKLNEIMKVLTMISTTVLPMTLVAGIYGMNFEKNMWPSFAHSEWGFAIALGLMLLTGLGSFVFFRWRKWI